jgi:hypothetical protein
MPSTLPKDIEADLRRDYASGIGALRGGGTMPIGTLGLHKDTRTRRFVVYCYSAKYYLANVTRDEAEERIATAKEEIEILLGLFPELRAEMQDLDLVFHFCYDTGKGAVLIATEERGHFEYVTSKA